MYDDDDDEHHTKAEVGVSALKTLVINTRYNSNIIKLLFNREDRFTVNSLREKESESSILCLYYYSHRH